MLIKRTTATHIMSRAIKLQGDILLAVMDSNESVTYCISLEEMQQLTADHPDAIWIYNQNSKANEAIDKLIFNDGQGSIEVFQDTRGVFGLRAYQMKGKIQTPVTLELSD
jgi:hypothetical protein